MQEPETEPINLRITLTGKDAIKYRKLMAERGLTVANQIVLLLLQEAYKKELGEA
mgnify:CR=1 FL=1